MEIETLLAIILTAVITLSVIRFVDEYKLMKKRITTLEEANRLRLPYKSYEEILDAIAAHNLYMEQKKFEVSLLENEHAHLVKAMQVGTKRER